MKYQFFIPLVICFLFIQCSSDNTTIDNIDQNRVIKKDNAAAEEKTLLKTGNYGDLLLAFDGKKVTGYYNMQTGNGQFGCAFFFKGKCNGKNEVIPIQWYFPNVQEKQKGQLILKKDKIQLKIDGNPGGQCMPELMGEGEIIKLSDENNWKDLGIIKSKKSTIYEESDDAMETGMYFKKGDVICVLEKKGKWLRVELAGEVNMGWIKASDLDI